MEYIEKSNNDRKDKKIICECGGSYINTNFYINRHFNTKKHKKYEDDQII